MTLEASHLAKSFENWSHTSKLEFVNRLGNDEYDYFRVYPSAQTHEKEMDVFDPTIETLISRSGAEAIIHHPSYLYENFLTDPDLGFRNNIEGTYHILETANKIGIPVYYITSPHIYHLYDGYLKDCYDLFTTSILSVDSLIKVHAKDYKIIIPGILYGEDYKNFLSSLIDDKKFVKIYQDLETAQPYTHTYDLFDGLQDVILNGFDTDDISLINDKEVYKFEDIFNYINKKISLYEYEIVKDCDDFPILTDWHEKFKLKHSSERSLYPTIDNIIKQVRANGS